MFLVEYSVALAYITRWGLVWQFSVGVDTQTPGLLKLYSGFTVALILIKILQRLKLTHNPNLPSFLTHHHSYPSLGTRFPVRSGVVGVISVSGQMQN